MRTLSRIALSVALLTALAAVPPQALSQTAPYCWLTSYLAKTPQ